MASPGLAMAFSALPLLLILPIDACSGLSLRPPLSPKSSPRQLVEKYVEEAFASERRRPPLARSIAHAPPSAWADDVAYTQRATDARISGGAKVAAACESFDADFKSDSSPEVSCSVGRISALSPDTVLVQWNVTWIPPTAAWLLAWPGETVPIAYNHLSGYISTFSWGAVWRLFRDAVLTGKVRVPLACVEGRSVLRFRPRDGGAAAAGGEGDGSGAFGWELRRIDEELSYAEDLRRGVLRNRRCASDLRLFLASGRRPPDVSWEEWEDVVARCLPWETVPGSSPLNIEPMSEEEGFMPAYVFIGVVVMVSLAFANFLAPQLIGQSFFRPPNEFADPTYGFYGTF